MPEQTKQKNNQQDSTGIAKDLAMINDSSPVIGLIDLWMIMDLWMLAEGQQKTSFLKKRNFYCLYMSIVYITQSSVLRTETDLDRSDKN